MNKHDIKGKEAADGAHTFIYLDDKDDADRVVEALSTYDMVTAYKAAEYPDYAHLGDDGRAGDILLVLDQPYWIASAEDFPWCARWGGLTLFWPETLELSAGIKATHGFPPDDTNMHTMFYAWGAGINPGTHAGTLDMIDATPTALSLLGIEPHESVSGVVRTNILADEQTP